MALVAGEALWLVWAPVMCQCRPDVTLTLGAQASGPLRGREHRPLAGAGLPRGDDDPGGWDGKADVHALAVTGGPRRSDDEDHHRRPPPRSFAPRAGPAWSSGRSPIRGSQACDPAAARRLSLA